MQILMPFDVVDRRALRLWKIHEVVEKKCQIDPPFGVPNRWGVEVPLSNPKTGSNTTQKGGCWREFLSMEVNCMWNFCAVCDGFFSEKTGYLIVSYLTLPSLRVGCW